LIMTTHGLSGLSRWVYGNVAGRVLQGAQSPVLLVRPRSE
jgi:nucleotide-binding universal stress UspA family protein